MTAGMTLRRALRSEAVRLRRSALVPLHLALAAGLGVAAGLYFSYAAWDSLLGADAFFQLVGAGAPLLAGISCGLAADAEREAGGFANVLGAPSRRVALAAKGIVLFALGVGAALVATGLFLALVAGAGRTVPALPWCAGAAGGLALGSAALYAGFLWVAMRFGRNASVGLGALGLIVAMASLGGLANGLVTGTLSGSFGAEAALVLPVCWPSRLASIAIELGICGPLGADAQTAAALTGALGRFAVVSAVGAGVLSAVLLVRANRFEDRRHAAE